MDSSLLSGPVAPLRVVCADHQNRQKCRKTYFYLGKTIGSLGCHKFPTLVSFYTNKVVAGLCSVTPEPNNPKSSYCSMCHVDQTSCWWPPMSWPCGLHLLMGHLFTNRTYSTLNIYWYLYYINIYHIYKYPSLDINLRYFFKQISINKINIQTKISI